jgi:exopolysaccharide biosynthesis polyprenyl glycosylphosphotransferase
MYSGALSGAEGMLPPRPAQLLRKALVSCERFADFATAAAAMAASLLLTNTVRPYQLAQLFSISMIAGFLAVLDMGGNHAYEGGGSLLHIRETERILRAATHCVLFTAPVLLAITPEVKTSSFAVAPLLVAGLLIAQKRCFFLALQHLDRRRDGAERVVVYGRGGAERRVVSALRRSVRLGLIPVAFIDDSPEASDRCVLELGYRSRNSIAVHASPITPELLIGCRCDTLVIVSDNLSSDQRVTAARCARMAGARVAFLSDPNLQGASPAHGKNLDGMRMNFDTELNIFSGLYDAIKRLVDLTLSSLALVVLSPAFLLIALLIRLDSTGPVIFIQDRVGLDGRPFKIYKFRSMHEDCSKYEPSPTTSMDPRLTKVGRILRRLSLDELPQFVNVVLGDMSLVGPRPEMPFIAQNYNSAERKRLNVMPGITGLWQLSGDRAFPIHESLDYDLYYIRHRGMFMDLAILIHTVAFAMRAGI